MEYAPCMSAQIYSLTDVSTHHTLKQDVCELINECVYHMRNHVLLVIAVIPVGSSESVIYIYIYIYIGVICDIYRCDL